MTRPEKGAYRDLLDEHASEQMDEELPSGWLPAKMGTRVEATLREGERPRWPSEAAALRELIESEDDGAANRSTSDPDRFVSYDRNTYRPSGDAAQRKVERLVEVRRAREGAYVGPWELPDGTSLPVSVCHDVLVWRVCGRQRHRFTRRKTVHHERVGTDPEQIADRLKSEGWEVGPRVVVQIAQHGRLRVREFLKGRGLIPGGEPMGDVPKIEKPWDYEGWSQVADAMGVEDIRTVQRWSRDPDYPMPVHPHPRFTVVAYKSELEEWLRAGVGRAG